MAFTNYETEQLHKALLKETRRCAVTLGMKKTSVDQLTKAVGIPRLLIRKHEKVSKINVFKGREHGTEVKKSHTDRHEGR